MMEGASMPMIVMRRRRGRAVTGSVGSSLAGASSDDRGTRHWRARWHVIARARHVGALGGDRRQRGVVGCARWIFVFGLCVHRSSFGLSSTLQALDVATGNCTVWIAGTVMTTHEIAREALQPVDLDLPL